MFATFNMGLGMVLVVPPDRAGEVVSRAGAAGVGAHEIGRVVPRPGVEVAG